MESTRPDTPRSDIPASVFQTFSESASPDQGPPRLTALRGRMRDQGLAGFVVPRADKHQGEYVPPCDERLAWLTGFTGSAGFAVALQNRAAIFTDSRYTVQVRAQTDDMFEKIDWPATGLATWINKAAPTGGVIGVDPWLFTVAQYRSLEQGLTGCSLIKVCNLIDQHWIDQPAPPMGDIEAHPLALAGESSEDKIAWIASGLQADALVLTLPDCLAWLMNIRGSDIPRNPIPHGFVIVHKSGDVDLFVTAEKLAKNAITFSQNVTVKAPEDFLPCLGALTGKVQIDPESCPVAVYDALEGAEIVEAADPVFSAKAIKNAAELQGTREAHIVDACAMVRFLCWLDAQPPGSLTEIDAACQLESERRANNQLRDISFDTISGTGPNAALPHYRVSRGSNRRIEAGQMLLVDSGGQYQNGTTDITRTIAIGSVGAEEKDAYTRVLKGMIAVSRLRFPKGYAGRDIDPFARAALWEAGLDYGHGTGHGVGAYLCVHEGPQRIARTSHIPLVPGMMLSNEPGFYKEGQYGIRIENLIAVERAPDLSGQTQADMLRFETLTWVPIDTRLIQPNLLTRADVEWLNAYHAKCQDLLSPLLPEAEQHWLATACAAI